MNGNPVLYAVLRDRRHWDGVTLTGFHQENDGTLTLAHVPSPGDAEPIFLPPPFNADASGLVIGQHNDLYISDTVNDRVVLTDGVCGSRVLLPGRNPSGSAAGQFRGPRGLLIAESNLYVADSGNARIQIFRLPSLELHAIRHGFFQQPTGLAADSKGRIYVLDRGFEQVLRFDACGIPDESYNAAMSDQLADTSPAFLCIGCNCEGADTLYIADDQSKSVLTFDTAAGPLGALPIGTSGSPIHPGALTIGSGLLYVADVATGSISVFDFSSKSYLGTAFQFVGPVAAMALDQNHTSLYLKSGLDETIYQLQTAGAYIPSGTLISSGPLDAGAGAEWERIHVEAEVPTGTSVLLQTFVNDDPASTPNNNWNEAPALDVLIPPLPGFENSSAVQKHYLWIRIQLLSFTQNATPRLKQVQAHTTADSYIDHLPAVYCRKDFPQRFLERWLALFRSKLSDLELLLDAVSRRFDPATTPDDYLPWLATWLAFDLPEGADATGIRKLLLRAHKLYVRRATPWGIREFVRLYAGATPHLFEAFRQRHLWQLSKASLLGFDTALPSADPDGMIIPGLTPADPNYLGLTGEYYAGINFDELRFTQTDAFINFDLKNGIAGPQIVSDVNHPGLSVRWTGQVQPRYSERYSFHVQAQDGVKLWIDYELIINTWIEPQTSGQSATVNLTAGRWYAITLEYYKRVPANNTGSASVNLSWSSRSQKPEVVPQVRLYSVLDDTASVDVPSPVTGCENILVGQAVVGASEALPVSDIGIPLFSDTAHLFTVSIPAAQVSSSTQLQKVKQILEAEKPAHTDFHLCLAEARMRIGFQARIGIDSIVAGPTEPMSLTETMVGFDSVLTAEPGADSGGRVGHGRVGQQKF